MILLKPFIVFDLLKKNDGLTVEVAQKSHIFFLGHFYTFRFLDVFHREPFKYNININKILYNLQFLIAWRIDACSSLFATSTFWSINKMMRKHRLIYLASYSKSVDRQKHLHYVQCTYTLPKPFFCNHFIINP